MSRTKCLNCEETVIHHYCSHCGQKSDTKRIDWHYLIHDVPHSVFHLDKGFLPTLIGMIIRPGEVIQQYLDGKRARYFRPLTYLFILGTLAGLIYLNAPMNLEIAKNQDTKELMSNIQKLLGKYYNIFTVAMIPLFSFFVWLFYRKERNFVEIMTAHFLIMGTVSILAVFNLLQYLTSDVGAAVFVSVFTTILSLFYYTYAYATSFTSRKPWARWLIAVLLVAISNLLTMVLAIILAMLYILFVMKKDNLEINLTL
jgi:hypothetical protein